MDTVRMTVADLVGEAEALSRRCLHLVADAAAAQPPVAVWGGPGPSLAPRGAGAHLLTVATTKLPPLSELSFPGTCISVYGSAKGKESAVTVHREDLLPALLRKGSGTPLVARPATSVPPLDAIFRFGSARIVRWLRELGWMENGVPYPYNDNFPDIEPTAAYERHWQAREPLFTGGVHAVVGGWHMSWPDGDWVERLPDRLLLWTLADAEPWVEVWMTSDGRLRVLERIT